MNVLLSSFFRKQPSAGLVIRSGEVEVLSTQGRRVISRVRVPVKGPEESQLVQAIQEAMNAAALPSKKLAVAIPTKDALFRFFTMPVIPKPEWETAVQFEARKYIPFKTEGLIWDYNVVQPRSAQKLDVIFAAIQRTTFERLQLALETAGVQPTMIEPESLSLARLITPTRKPSSQEFVCVVNIDQETAHLAIVKDQLPHLTRDITLSNSAGPATVSDASGMSAPAILRPLESQDPTLSGLPEGEPTAPIDHRGQRLLSELSVSIDFFRREYPSSTIAQVLLFGDESVIGPWCRWLAEQLHCAVELGHHCLEQHVDGGVPLSSASVVGLVHAAANPAAASLDFLKRSLAKPTTTPVSVSAKPTLTIEGLRDFIKTSNLGVMASVCAGLLFVLWFTGTQRLAGERQQLAQLVQSRSDVGWGLNRMKPADLTVLKETATSHLAFLKRVVDGRTNVAAKLDALAHTLPDGVWLTGLTFDDRLDATGHSASRLLAGGACFLKEPGQELSAIQQFEHQVKRNQQFFGGFSAARIEQISAQVHTDQQQQYTYRTFQLQCTSDRKL